MPGREGTLCGVQVGAAVRRSRRYKKPESGGRGPLDCAREAVKKASVSRKSSSWESWAAGKTRNSGAVTAAVASDVAADLWPAGFLKRFPQTPWDMCIPGRLRLEEAEEDPFPKEPEGPL